MSVLPMSSINILCPNVALVPTKTQTNVPMEQLYENLWVVDKTSYDACVVDTTRQSNRRILVCNDPLTLKKRYLMVFQMFSATPGGLEFMPGQTYYFIATSDGSKVSLGATSKGHCASHSMKIAFYVCTDTSDLKCKATTTPTPAPCPTQPPTTVTLTTAVTPLTCASPSDVQAVRNQTDLLPSIQQQINNISGLMATLQTMKLQLDEMGKKLDTCTQTQIPARETCKAHLLSGHTASGIYMIDPGKTGKAFDVYCDQTTDSGGWAVVQRRFNGSVDFYRGWNDYRDGFGSLKGEFWLGLDKIYRLASSPVTLRVDLMAADGEERFAQFAGFKIGDAASKYVLTSGTYSGGTAGDSLSFSDGSKFSTYDQDNDNWDVSGCAQQFKGAWWHKTCHESSLNGLYRNGSHPGHFADGIIWKTWKGYTYSYTSSSMMVKS